MEAGSALSATIRAAGDLAAAIQFLGYRHIIASMWTIADSPAPYLADTFYNTLTQDGRPDSNRTAEALHQAVPPPTRPNQPNALGALHPPGP
jgi:CHAT domain-containing protein